LIVVIVIASILSVVASALAGHAAGGDAGTVAGVGTGLLIGLPLLLLLGYFLMYVPAAVLIGNEGGVAAIKTSFRLTTQRVGESAIAWLGMFLAMIAGSIANSIAIHIPIVNLIAGFAIGGFTSAYSALLSVSYYLALKDYVPPPPAALPPRSYGGPPSVIQ
jgi:hypothetical protein